MLKKQHRLVHVNARCHIQVSVLVEPPCSLEFNLPLLTCCILLLSHIPVSFAFTFYVYVPQGYGAPPQYGGAPYAQQPYPQQYPAQPGTVAHSTVYVTQGPLANPVNDYLGYSIFTMLCCCLPLGIAALIYSISVSFSYKYFWLVQSHRAQFSTRPDLLM